MAPGQRPLTTLRSTRKRRPPRDSKAIPSWYAVGHAGKGIPPPCNCQRTERTTKSRNARTFAGGTCRERWNT
jgi:hypothetical protein